MATFKVYGADRDSGKDRSERIEASTPDEAELIASHRGMLVSSLVEVELESAEQHGPPPAQYRSKHKPRPDRPVRVRTPETQTIEATGKQWKFAQLLAAIGIPVGIVMMATGSETGDPISTSGIGIIVIFASFALYVFARFAAWWHHG